MIETILSDKTDERRRLFEEAAGVTKYKHRRKAAYRKLEAVQADLVRVNDIVAEVQKAVNSLERQAKKAEQYNGLKAKLRAFEADLMERDYAQLVARIKPLEEKFADMTSNKEKIDVDLSQEEARLEDLRVSTSDVERRLAEAQRDVSLHMEKINRIEQKNLVAAERMSALESNIARYEQENKEQQAEENHLEELVVTLEEKIVDIRSQQEQVTGEFERHKVELAEATRLLDEKKAELESLNERTIELVHAIAEKQTEQDKLKGRAENLHGRASHAVEENQAYDEELLRLAQDIADLTTEDKQMRRAFSEEEVRYYEAERKKKELEEKVDAFQREEMELHGEIQRRSARTDFLKGLIESREGFSESVRFLATTDRWKKSEHRLTVGDALHVDDRYATAIETALGDYANLIIVNSLEEAESGIALLKEEQKGKATFVCLDRLPRVLNRYMLPEGAGVIGWAIEHVRFDPLHESLFRFLLDRVLLVTDASTAKEVSARSGGIRCVTLEGESSTSAGVARGGSMRQDEGGTIGKQNQIEQLQREREALAAKLDAIKLLREEVAVEQEAIQLKTFGDAVKSVEKEMNSIEMRIAQLEFERKRANDIIARNNEEISSLKLEAEEMQTIIAQAAPELERLREEKAVVERSVGAAVQERDSLASDFNERSTTVKELEIKIIQLDALLQNTESELQHSRDTIATIISALDKREAAILSAQQEIQLTKSSVDENASVLALLMQELSVLDSRKLNVERENLHLREEMHRIQLKVKDERRTHDDAMKAVHDIEMKIADLKAKIEHLKEKAFTEFEMQLELKTYPEDEFVDFEALRDEIQRFRDKIKSLGNINFAAFEEYSEEKQRFEFLSSQRADLVEAEKTLLATIEEINATAQRKFLDTFEKIRVNFVETFKSLFDPGDECDLKLEEEVDPLEAGIDIIAKPRGKRPTSIHLLSGGEKTLTATALLFAIYLVKPSPFCILDEVDAPLDDANVDRFTRILRKFSDNTQFIVVTHNKRTMEAANALYGVTMEEEGVSKLVTVRFNQASQVQSAAVVSG
jgi:chromosome segregation protein